MRKGLKNGKIPVSIALKALKQAGFDVPSRYDSLMAGGQGQSATPFGDVASVTQSFLGVPYKWGGNSASSGLDCSAFVQQAMAKFGVTIPRTTYAQAKVGQPVALSQLQPGDCVFTEPGKNGPNHVGLYIGNGKIQESPHTGDVNKIIPLQDFLGGGFVAARRYLSGN
jgi:cell wall-associated NlpC family hydrolase